MVSPSVHQGTDLCVDAFFVFRNILNDLLQAETRISWNSSTIVSMLRALATLKRRVSSNCSRSPTSLFDLQNRCSISWRITCNFTLSSFVTLYLTPSVFTPTHRDVPFPSTNLGYCNQNYTPDHLLPNPGQCLVLGYW